MEFFVGVVKNTYLTKNERRVWGVGYLLKMAIVANAGRNDIGNIAWVRELGYYER